MRLDILSCLTLKKQDNGIVDKVKTVFYEKEYVELGELSVIKFCRAGSICEQISRIKRFLTYQTRNKVSHENKFLMEAFVVFVEVLAVE